jgi:hypothetical protein
MDSKLVLAKCLTLLICENKASNGEIKSSELITKAIGKLKLPEQISETDVGRFAIINCRQTAYELIADSSKDVYNIELMIQQLRIDCGQDLTFYEAVEPVQRHVELPTEQLMGICRKLREDLTEFLEMMEFKDILSKAYRKLNFASDENVDWKSLKDEVTGAIEGIHTRHNKVTKAFLLNLASMADPSSLANILQKAKDENEGKGAIVSGWQRVNKMCGETLAFRRGMMVCVGALTHCYKSGFVHDLFRHACVYNTPEPCKDPNKKPALLYFSSENRAEEDLVRMYVALKENETGVAVNVKDIDPVEASEYMIKRLTATGFHVDMLRVDGNAFTVMDLFNTVIEYEAAGFEIQAIYFDYLALINKKGLNAGVAGEDIRHLMQTTRVFMSARDILFVTPHQLSQEAMTKKREGVSNFLAEVAGKNYWDGSKRIANEFDMEIFLDYLEDPREKGKFWLHVWRGKHRTVKKTPQELRHFYLPFAEVGYIPDDIHGEDRGVSELSAASQGGIIWN